MADLVFPLQEFLALARLVYGLQLYLLPVLLELPRPGCRTSAVLVSPRLVLSALVRLVCCLLVFWLSVACRLSAPQLRKAMVAMAPVERAPPSALE